MRQEVARHLITDREGIYLDGTLGGGGHAEIILSRLMETALYIGIDRDNDAVNYASERLKNYVNFQGYCTSFDNIESVLSKENIGQFHGLFLDLGVSSWQIDQDERGFSFRPGVNLDMRMDSTQSLNAHWIINNYTAEDLKRIFKEYGEERNSGKIARLITQQRMEKEILKSTDLLKIIDRCVNPRFATKSYARIFQALRIEVNNELNILKKTLDIAVEKLRKGGKLVVLTYHSLEDRIVKQFLHNQENPCTCPPGLPVCVCQKVAKLKLTKPHFIIATDDEIGENPRARSAKLRVAEKI
jgi:16S rRNA (cytosine1402-N4)-methyltransferase